MRRAAVLLLCSAPAWAAAYTSARSGNWSDAAAWSPGGIPGNGDTVVIATGHAITVDTSVTVGSSGAPVYSYVAGLTVTAGGSGYTSCSVSWSGGTVQQAAAATCTQAGGAVQAAVLTLRGWYAPASAAPAVSFGGGGTGAAATVQWTQGGGTAAVLIQGTGTLTVASGATLTARGDILWSGTAKTDAVILQPGGSLVLDSSQAASPSTTMYSMGPSGAVNYRIFHADCTAGQRCSVSSVATGGALPGSLSQHGFANAMSVSAQYADFSNLGDARTPAIRWHPSYNNLQYAVEHSSFTNCGAIDNSTSLGADTVFKHNYNLHSGSLASSVFGYFSATTALGAGSRELIGNALDRSAFVPGSGANLRDFTVTDNYFGDTFIPLVTSYRWAGFARNFVRGTGTANGVAIMAAGGDVTDSYFFHDAEAANPHTVTPNNNFATTYSGNIFGFSGPYSTDSGEVMSPPTSLGSPTTYTENRNILLPNAYGQEWAELASILTNSANLSLVMDHNAWFGGTGFGALQTNETQSTASQAITSFRSNLMWAAAAGTSLKLNTASNSLVVNTDACLPAKCDYNAGYNLAATQANCSNCTNQGRGYASKFSATPGAHDIDGEDPRLADHRRSVELFDSKYLGNAAPQWSSGGTYAAGDMVSNTSASLYWGERINYRCAATAGCTGAPAPGVGTNWRSYWEWASLYRLREGLAAQRTFTDGATGADGDTIVTALIKWIRRGYTPQNAKLRKAAHDGTDIGAVALDGPRTFPGVVF